jgi:hypothetical protein
MANTNTKTKTKEVKEEINVQQEQTFIENEQPKKVEQPKKNIEPEFEYRDRLYVLTNGMRPLLFTLPSKHSSAKPLLYFDKELKKTREIRYATNQSSPLVDEQNGTVTLGRISFRAGVLNVPKEDIALQKLLSLYHPLKGILYEEYNAVQEAEDDFDALELELEAMNLASELDIDQLEAILRVEVGSKVSKMTTKELKRDALIFARRKPGLFIELANDENIELRNIGIKAVEMKIINLSSDQRTFTFGDNNRKLMTVPFNENPYSALAAYFKTDEGVEVYNHLIKRLK